MALLAPAAHGKGLELIMDVAEEVPAALIGDARRLRQIVVNLVGNAVKFTDRGHVLVRVRPDAETYGGMRLRFDVQDTGIGIPIERQARIFEPFVHGNLAGREGVGLGLAITRRLVEAMGGEVSVDSTPGAGTTFSFVLPFTRPADADLPRADVAGVRVLVVDASDTRRDIVGRWLTAWQARPTLVADVDAARGAVETARRAGSRFAVVLLAADVPGGVARLADADIRAAVVASSTGDRAVDAPARAGVVALRKPFSPDQLRAALADAVATSRDRAPAPDRARQSARPLRVLVVDDSATNLSIACSLLERWGHVVTRRDDGRAAVAAVRDAPYDLVLMDVRMAGVDGLEATRLIRAAEPAAGPRVPIVAMTASAMKGDRELCLDAGMDGYLAKPIDADELFALVERVATGRGAAR
jgi:two-component system, sensor histidine kinase and response regulator